MIDDPTTRGEDDLRGPLIEQVVAAARAADPQAAIGITPLLNALAFVEAIDSVETSRLAASIDLTADILPQLLGSLWLNRILIDHIHDTTKVDLTQTVAAIRAAYIAHAANRRPLTPAAHRPAGPIRSGGDAASNA